MRYRHSFHAGNFADIHKHAALLALLAALERKEKGFLYVETHAGRGEYDAAAEPEPLAGLLAASHGVQELERYAHALRTFRDDRDAARIYPGSPLLAARELRRQDRAVLIESQPAEARALERAVSNHANVRVECADGFERLRAHLPPKERRALVLIDPPYEETARDFDNALPAIQDALRRFDSCVIALWYPIKKASDLKPWHARIVRAVTHETLLSELWVHPTDSRVALNGSGLLIVNPPYRLAERMQIWLPELAARLDPRRHGGASVRWLTPPR